MKKALAIALAVLFVLAFAVPAFAQSMVHTVKEAYVDAQIDIERQHGHLCNTGAQLMYSVKGSAAEFMAERAITQVAGKITVSKDEAAWVAGATPLTVTSVIELCAPAKHEYEVVQYTYGADGWGSAVLRDGVVSTPAGYGLYGWEDYLLSGTWPVAGTPPALADTYTVVELSALTDQIWAVQVQSDAGFSGNLEQTWEAAYGTYAPWIGDGPAATHKKGFWFELDDDGYVTVELGDDYVGNYFNIDQHARVSQGHLYRYIDISSPFSHAYVSEYSEVTGKADVQEAFAMGNLGPGSDVATDWWDLF